MAPKKKETQVADVPFQQVSCNIALEYAMNLVTMNQVGVFLNFDLIFMV